MGPLRKTSLSVVASLALLAGVAPEARVQTVLIPMGATWKFLANGSNQGTAWRALDFDDSSWAKGPAELGYGEGDEVTTVASGTGSISHFITTYFRTLFTVENPTRYAGLSGKLVYDDGAVIYLNGTEVFRINMPAGPASFNTLATDAVDYEPVAFAISAGRLRAGVNVVAVEMHQGDSGSSDISFDLQLGGVTAR